MRNVTLYVAAFCAALFFVVSCASIGNPSGGPRDEDPPRFLTSTPLQGAVEVTPNKIVLSFDEYITLKDAFSKVVVSPPGAQVPRVSSLGRRVTVEFRDSLLPNTTYTIDFGDAIADNNEGNKLENFIYTFSTGPTLDSLMVSGMVLGAEDLVPPEGIYVGLHSAGNDSAFITRRFDRVAKTDANGKFVIGGLAPGQYRVYALDDKDGDLKWSSPEESLAFYDFIVEPRTEQTVTTDTLFNLRTGEVDSIARRERVRFLPNNILLRYFNTGFKQQYITKYERVDSTRINLIFNAPAPELPTLDLVTLTGNTFSWPEVALAEHSPTNDTITLWLKDRNVIQQDTLRLALEYLRADSTYTMLPVNDTLRLITQRPKVKEEKVKKPKNEKADTLPPPVPTLAWKVLNTKPEINQSLYIESPEPLEFFDPQTVRLEMKNDTLWVLVPDFDTSEVAFDEFNPRKLKIPYKWDYATTYRVTIDSLAGKGIYGLMTDDLSLEFTSRDETEYGSLKFNLSNMGSDTIPRFVQLLDAQGSPVRKEILEGRSVKFDYLLPGNYNARIIEDYNGNGVWDPGDPLTGRQPDLSYYYKETVELKPHWDQEIDWNVFGTPVDKMIPPSLNKNKSKTSSRF